MQKSYLLAILFIATLTGFSQTNRSLSVPFIEDWSSGTFETNGWITECSNWVIANHVGNDSPSAEFQWDPHLQNDYSCALESDTINAEDLLVGEIKLQFEVKLNDRNATGNEKLIVEVYDGEAWNMITEFINEGDLDWTFNYHDITEFTLGKSFLIRFRAAGDNSFDIISWFVDNIEIYRVCKAPDDLDAFFFLDDEYGVINEISWDAPETISPWYGPVHWDTGENNGGTGRTDGGDISVAMRFDENSLSGFDGATCEKISFYLADSGFANIIVKIWTGNDASNLIYSDTVENLIINSYNDIEIDSTIYIDADLEYWIGYRVINQEADSEPIGIDEGPSIYGYGNMYSLDEEYWEPTDTISMNWNWNIWLWVLKDESTSDYLNGYNLYRYVVGVNDDYQFYDYIPHSIGNTFYTYFDTVENYRIPNHCYKVNALWVSESDTCTSPFARYVIPIWDYACVIYEGINDLIDTELKVYPNPVKKSVGLKSEASIEQISILNLQGQILLSTERVQAGNQQIDVSSLEPGIYFLKVKTGKETITKKFIKVE